MKKIIITSLFITLNSIAMQNSDNTQELLAQVNNRTKKERIKPHAIKTIQMYEEKIDDESDESDTLKKLFTFPCFTSLLEMSKTIRLGE